MEGSPVGFISLDAPTEIDLLYVHPGGGRAGRRHACCTTRWRSFRPRAARRTCRSTPATPRANSSTQRGFTPQQRNTVSVGNEWLSNTTMKKKLAANEDTP